jgi:hypothetical protein
MVKSFRSTVIIILAVLWLFIVVVNYHIVHKLFTGENSLAILYAFDDVLVAVTLFALAATIG